MLRLPLALLLLATHVAAIWPRPADFRSGNQPLRVNTSDFGFTAVSPLPDDVYDAIKSTTYYIGGDTLKPLEVGRGAARRSAVDAAPLLREIRIELGGKSPEAVAQHLHSHRSPPGAAADKGAQKLLAKKRAASAVPRSITSEIQQDVSQLDEAYKLVIPADGSPGTLSANSSLGIFRGLETITQLIYALPGELTTAHYLATRYIWNAPIEINDKPAFPYRGLLLDTSRNFYPTYAIKRVLTVMSFAKLNQFHWHITDAQAFPLVLPGRLSVLSEKGAYGADQVYTADDVKDIMDFAGKRGINVNIEIDMPGHTYMGVVDLDPSLVVCPNQPDWGNWANEPPSGQLALGSSAVDSYVAELIEETSKLIAGPYFAHGNDEVNLNCYNATSKEELDAPYLKPFVEKVHANIQKAGKTPMVWEEAAIDFPETGKILAKGTIVEAWTGADGYVPKILASNPDVRLIHAPYQAAYLDVGRGSWLGNTTAPSYAPYVSWQNQYVFDPYNGTTVGDPRILGGEMALWGEQSDENVLDGLLWPRAASAAEVYWTGASATTNGKTDQRSMTEALPRLHDWRYRIVGRGIQATPIQPLWCALRDGQCNYPI